MELKVEFMAHVPFFPLSTLLYFSTIKPKRKHYAFILYKVFWRVAWIGLWSLLTFFSGALISTHSSKACMFS